MSDHLKAKNILGDQAFNLIHEQSTTFEEQQLKDFALLLGEIYKDGKQEPNKISGKHQSRSNGSLDNNALMRYILGDWYNEELYDMSRSTALQKLIKIFYGPEVNCKPLASQLKFLLHSEDTSSCTEPSEDSGHSSGGDNPEQVDSGDCEESRLCSRPSEVDAEPQPSPPTSLTRTASTMTAPATAHVPSPEEGQLEKVRFRVEGSGDSISEDDPGEIEETSGTTTPLLQASPERPEVTVIDVDGETSANGESHDRLISSGYGSEGVETSSHSQDRCNLRERMKQNKNRLVIASLLMILVFVSVIVIVKIASPRSSPSETCPVFLGGGNFTPSDQVVGVPDQCSCPEQIRPLSPLPMNLTGQVQVVTPDGRILLGGGTDRQNHDARKVFLWDAESEKWEPLESFNIPRISACVKVQGTKVKVWGGRSSDPEKNTDCHLSTEEFDLPHPELGWTLTEHKTNDPSFCEVQFICEEHESLELNYK